MKRVLLPMENTQRSLSALQFFKKTYKSDEAEVVIMMVDESLSYAARPDEEEQALRMLSDKLDLIENELKAYKVIKRAATGKAGVKIVRVANDVGADEIIMTKSSKEDMLSAIGRTADYVINNATCPVVIVSESKLGQHQYRGLVYNTVSSVVNLRGKLGDKQSECLLPSVNQDCIYHIDVTVGKIRFLHTSYNPDTRNWDLPPMSGQEAIIEIGAGESVDIFVKADSTCGKADRIRIVNRDMKKEAVFSYSIKSAIEE